jgi:hypothetical protein
LLTQVQESIFQISFDLLLDALQHVIRTVALVPFKYWGRQGVIIISQPLVKAAVIAHTIMYHDRKK